MQTEFVKIGDLLVNTRSIRCVNCVNIEKLQATVWFTDESKLTVDGMDALQLLMKLSPSILEGKRLRWPKFVWLVHNLIGHPIMGVLSLFGLYKWAFWVHDSTIPHAIGIK